MVARKLISASAALLAALTGDAAILFSQDHADALYHAGEVATFTVTVTDDATGAPLKTGKATWSLDNFGSTKFGNGTQDLAVANPFAVSGKLETDGFLRVSVSATAGTNRVRKCWAVGYDVTKICQTEPRPADFDAYWAAEKARIRREIPLDAKMTRDEKQSDASFDVFRVNFATFNGGRVYGFLSVPTDKAAAPFPFHICVPGAGPGYIAAEKRAKTICLVMNVHQFEPERTREEQKRHMDEANAVLAKKFALPNPKAYCSLAGIAESREAYHYHDVLLGIDRAIDWVVARSDVDKACVNYSGSSQGGMFGLYLSYLNPNIRKAFVAVCAGTGHFASRQNREDGWPKLVRNQAAEKREAAARNAAYFDGVNFAAGVKIPIRFIVGFADTTCPPHNVYAAYNACPSADKEIAHAIGGPHSWTSVQSGAEAGKRYQSWLYVK